MHPAPGEQLTSEASKHHADSAELLQPQRAGKIHECCPNEYTSPSPMAALMPHDNKGHGTLTLLERHVAKR